MGVLNLQKKNVKNKIEPLENVSVRNVFRQKVGKEKEEGRIGKGKGKEKFDQIADYLLHNGVTCDQNFDFDEKKLKLQFIILKLKK